MRKVKKHVNQKLHPIRSVRTRISYDILDKPLAMLCIPLTQRFPTGEVVVNCVKDFSISPVCPFVLLHSSKEIRHNAHLLVVV